MSNSVDLAIRKRKPLELQAKKPVAIRLLTPQFEEKVYVDKKKNVNNSNQQQEKLNKLKRKVRREKKGAVREIRKDNWVISTEKIKQQKEQTKQREQSKNKIMNLLSQEESEHKKEKKLKKKSAF